MSDEVARYADPPPPGVYAVFTLRVPLADASPDQDTRELLTAATRQFDDVLGDVELPPKTAIEVTAEKITGTVEERAAA